MTFGAGPRSVSNRRTLRANLTTYISPRGRVAKRGSAPCYRARPALAQVRERHAGALAEFLQSSEDDEETDRFIDHPADLVACLNGEDAAGACLPGEV